MNHLLKFILLLLLVGLFNSCHIQQNVAGIYTASIHGRYPNTIPVTNYIELKNDGTFYYQYKGGFIEKVSYGKWGKGMNNKRIYVKSTITNLNNIPISVKEAESYNDYCVFIFDNPLRSNTGVKWILNIDGKNYQLNTDSLILKGTTKMCKFYLEGYLSYPDNVSLIPFPLQDRIRSETYKVKDEKNNLYHISFAPSIDYSIFYYMPFSDSLTINRRTIFVDEIKMKKLTYSGQYGNGRWFVPDPLVEEAVWSYPFSFNQNNPINRIDLTGRKDNPVYDTYGNSLCTNDLGLQGDAIVMDKSDFKQGMSLEESMSKHKGYNSFVSEDAKNKYIWE